MFEALNELKIQAKKLLKGVRQNNPSSLTRITKFNRLEIVKDELKLKHCQQIVAREIGFNDWQHAQSILIGKVQSGDNTDMGTFWHKPACNALLNFWFSSYQEAQAHLLSAPNHYLFPYKRQFVVANVDYINALGLSEIVASAGDNEIRDFVSAYPAEEWGKLAAKMITLQYSH